GEELSFSGIGVDAAAGNRGPNADTIGKPGDDPVVVTVGAANSGGTSTTGGSPNPSDDATASFSSRGPTQDGLSKPDLLSPGISIVSLRDPGSTIDQSAPAARVGDSYFKGTGSSQSAAITSGMAA